VRVVIAGGGTGGHLYPGLALAAALAARGAAPTFVGTAGGIEVRAVPAAGWPLRLVPGRQVRGGGALRGAIGLAALGRAVVAARRVLAEVRPALIVGVGGYASVAAVLAARLGARPVVLLEQNVIPGAANRLLGRLARRICLGFAESAAFFAPGRAVHTGNPVRADVLAARDAPPAPRADGRLGLLVFGGSAGAHRLNEAAVAALRLRAGRAPGFDVVHQTGAADVDAVRNGYSAAGIAARTVPFVDGMGAAYAAADVVVGRAGAMTCSELAVVGRPAILVPYPYAADDHQRRNAEVLVAAGAAELILDRDLDGERLAAALDALAGEPARRCRMAAAARALGRPDAAERVADACMALVSRA
jgi:UDP-N-acetylglucosamine--N-acetylmuramyl-(pentapeptide) pyrophosphoryl-undecaprenol N-acetylglucosamine transferase